MTAPSSYADQVFADQFQATADGSFVYRMNKREASLRVSSDERAAFIEAFTKARKRLTWGFVAGTLFVVSVITFAVGPTDKQQTDTAIYVSTGVSVAVFFLIWRWEWRAPSRALRNRLPESPALSKTDARQAGLKELTWSRLALVGLMAIIGTTWLASKPDPLSGWNRLWAAVATFYVGMLLWRVWQKWHVEREE